MRRLTLNPWSHCVTYWWTGLRLLTFDSEHFAPLLSRQRFSAPQRLSLQGGTGCFHFGTGTEDLVVLLFGIQYQIVLASQLSILVKKKNAPVNKNHSTEFLTRGLLTFNSTGRSSWLVCCSLSGMHRGVCLLFLSISFCLSSSLEFNRLDSQKPRIQKIACTLDCHLE